MMKRYIRTEEGYIIDTQNTYPFLISNYMGNDYIDFNSLGRFKIKSQADTIEELFDYFVDYYVNYYEGKDSHIISKEEPYRLMYGHEIYGAIWTKWGLKYVAKLNEKGEFELLE